DNIKDPMVKMFWTDEFANYDPKWLKEAISPIQNKVGQFLSSAIIRNIVGQPKSTIDLRQIMDERKILLMDLSKGKVGEENAALLGAMIITKIQLAAMSRVDMVEADRPDFYLYVDEFQNFATESFATILSEARKYHLSLIMGHQYIGQLTPDKSNTRLRDAIFGNVGTIVCFRVGAADAEYLETEFAPTYTPNDLVNLPKYHILLKLMINGVASEPFSAQSIPVNPEFLTGNSEKVIRVSRERYGNPIDQVEEKISRWMGVEYHQQNALVVGGDDSQAGGELPAGAQFLDQPQSVKVLPLQAGVIQQTMRPKEADSLTNIPEAPAPASGQAAPSVGTQTADGLVFRMPEPPKPAPPQPYVKNSGSQQPVSAKPQQVEKRPVSPSAGGGQSAFQGPRATQGFERQRPKQQEPSRNPKSKDRPKDRQPNKPQRPNIWETVAGMNEERTSQVVESLGAAIQDAHTSKPTDGRE
ncbi:MAG: TraM recognition domain-containing protein, partial [Candidatus Doudnabacteria bacterium]|nr:TraM recognition domain-containing protein [Candidatus Doudnabacteria bacterium]